MSDKVEYGYIAEAPAKKKLGSVTKKIDLEKRAIDPNSLDFRQKEMMNRVLNRVKLPNVSWTSLVEDFKNKEPKDFICRKYGIKPADLKYIKKYLNY
jgi:replicative superfamily II helicase